MAESILAQVLENPGLEHMVSEAGHVMRTDGHQHLPPLAVYSLLCLANLPAGLTHYGTTPAPILFGLGYVSLRDWWRVGFIVSLANMALWLTVGFGWWKLIGLW